MNPACPTRFAARWLRQLARASRSPSRRTAWILRPFLYAAFGTVALWNWHLHVAGRIFTIDLDVEASAPCAVPAGAPLPVRVVVAPMTGGCVRSDVHWCALDERGTELARGDVTCYGQTTLKVQDAARVRTIVLTVRGPHGERSLHFERTGTDASDRAATTCVADAMDLCWQAKRERAVALWFSAAGLVACGVWFAAELGAWLARRVLRHMATWRWQCLAALMIALPITVSWWSLTDREILRANGWLANAWIVQLMGVVRYFPSPFD